MMTTEAARTKARVTFTDFDTTSEISGLDGSTYIVVTVQFAVDHGGGPRTTHASIGVSTLQSRRTYELVEPAWVATQPELAHAILDYVREAERIFRSAAAAHDHRSFERTVDLELDVTTLPA
jgi:hypothetical protein